MLDAFDRGIPGHQTLGDFMKKLALLVAVAVAAAAPSVAFAAKKKAAQPAAATDLNANSKKFVRDLSMQPVYALRSATQPVAKADAKPAKKSAKKAAKKKAK
jgi:hypothetical protein